MGTDAHRGTQLALGSPYAAIAADRDCVFLAHYGVSLEESIRGIKPLGNPGVILRRMGGKFSGAAYIMGDTTELAANGNLNLGTSNGWWVIDGSYLSAAMETWPTTDCPNEFGRVMKSTTIAANPANINHSFGLAYDVTLGAPAANRTFTPEVWVIGAPGDVVTILMQSTDWSVNVFSASVTLTGLWQPIRVTGTFTSAATSSTVHLRMSFNQGRAGQVAHWTDLSLKELAYPTCHGSNSGDALAYPIDNLIPDRTAWTMSGWFKPLRTAAQGGGAMAFTLGRSTMPETEDWLGLGWNVSSNHLDFFSQRKSGPGTIGCSATVQNVTRDGSSYHLALTFDWASRKYLVYVNGELRATADCSLFPSAPTYSESTNPTYNQRGFIGYSDRLWSSVAVSELRFDRRVVPADEIKSWAQARSPFYPKGLHRILLDGYLQSGTAVEVLQAPPPPPPTTPNAPYNLFGVRSFTPPGFQVTWSHDGLNLTGFRIEVRRFGTLIGTATALASERSKVVGLSTTPGMGDMLEVKVYALNGTAESAAGFGSFMYQ